MVSLSAGNAVRYCVEDVKRMLRENVTIQHRPERNCEGLHFVRNSILGEGMQGCYSLIEEECVWLRDF